MWIAAAPWGSDMRDRSQLYEMTVRPKGRTPADEYHHRGETWIEGRYNSWYQIELANHTNCRVLAVLSVDGLSVMDGESASYDSPGFVLDPWGKTQVPGWLMNSDQAAQFVFSSVGKSYAHNMNKGGNPGVIGVAWFPERVNITKSAFVAQSAHLLNTTGNNPWDNLPRSISHVANSITTACAQGSNMGTAWGDSVQFATHNTQFVRASNTPAAVLVLRYDSADNLQAMGIRLRERASASSSQAFPANNSSYCKPPPVWARKN